MKRMLLVVAAGLIGILLGVGLSLAADAIAGSELSDPVPLGIATLPPTSEPTKTAEHERPSATPTRDDAGESSGSGETESPQTDGSGDQASSGSDGSSDGSDDSGHDEGDD